MNTAIEEKDIFWMHMALEQAQKAAKLFETPVGAIIIKDDKLIASGYNRREIDNDPTAHAEMIAIREASGVLGGWRLTDCTLYVTLEPCAMCSGALLQSRISRVVFGARDPKAGCIGSIYDLSMEQRFNHQFSVTEGVLGKECGAILSHFFRQLRETRRDGRVVDCARLESEWTVPVP